jgi:hypothetical protein
MKRSVGRRIEGWGMAPEADVVAAEEGEEEAACIRGRSVAHSAAAPVSRPRGHGFINQSNSLFN